MANNGQGLATTLLSRLKTAAQLDVQALLDTGTLSHPLLTGIISGDLFPHSGRGLV